MKKFLLFIICGVLLVGITGCFKESKEQTSNNNSNEVNNTENNNAKDDNKVIDDSKGLVLYFSATGTTEKVAKRISEITGSEIVEIIPKEEYTSSDLSYNNDNCRANKEQNNPNARPEIKNNINIDQYDTIYLGYPIWWGTNPKIILTLLDIVNFDGKNVVLFSTSHSSEIESSISSLKKYNSNMNVLGGKGFNSNSSTDDIKSWLNSLKR